MRLITEKQLIYLNILLKNALGKENRRVYLKLFYQVKSSKELTLEQASEIISKFVSDNPDREKEIEIAKDKIYEHLGQRRLFSD